MKVKIIVCGVYCWLLAGCQGGMINTSHNEISVQSEPAGASVYVMGELRGTTPIKLNMTDLYPASYAQEQAHLYGHVVLKHQGCKDLAMKVKYDVDSDGINGKLECGDQVVPAVNEHAQQPASLSEKTAKQRLQELQTLKDEGLITDKEYQQVRARILQSI